MVLIHDIGTVTSRPGNHTVLALTGLLGPDRKLDRLIQRLDQAGKPPPMLIIFHSMPSSSFRRPKITFSLFRAASQAPISRCWEPTWNDSPHGARTRARARISRSMAKSVWQPNLRDSGESAVRVPPVRISTYTFEPGAALAMLRRSASESVAYIRTPFS